MPVRRAAASDGGPREVAGADGKPASYSGREWLLGKRLLGPRRVTPAIVRLQGRLPETRATASRAAELLAVVTALDDSELSAVSGHGAGGLKRN